MSEAAFEAVIGIEIHVQLATRTKMFCGCELSFGDPPNTHTCPVCLAHPGALPVANAEAIRLGALTGLALGCDIAERSEFHRKNYFYPDLPKAYQISQFELHWIAGFLLHNHGAFSDTTAHCNINDPQGHQVAAA